MGSQVFGPKNDVRKKQCSTYIINVLIYNGILSSLSSIFPSLQDFYIFKNCKLSIFVILFKKVLVFAYLSAFFYMSAMTQHFLFMLSKTSCSVTFRKKKCWNPALMWKTQQKEAVNCSFRISICASLFVLFRFKWSKVYLSLIILNEQLH